MIDLLVEGFRERVCFTDDSDRIRARLELEKSRLMDPGYLQDNVIGKPRWAWDFESLNEGFMELVGPFMAKGESVSHLYLQALRELTDVRPEHEHVITILEYSHTATLIEDYYDFNELFYRSVMEPQSCAKLTQLKFAGQFLTLYPTHLVIRNALRADAHTLLRVYRWLRNTSFTWGTSRGVMLKWIKAGFDGVLEEHYKQNAINALCTTFISPVVVAAIIAGKPETIMRPLKEALSWLALSVKLRCERNLLAGRPRPQLNPYDENSWLFATLPGMVFLRKKLKPEGFACGALAAVHAEMTKRVKNGLTGSELAELEEDERSCFGKFSEGMRRIEFAPVLVQRLAACLGHEVKP